MNKYKVDKATLHIALATFPQNNKNDKANQNSDSQETYIKGIEGIFEKSKSKSIDNFRDKKLKVADDYTPTPTIENEFKNYFKPLKYYILGGYDICFITLVGSYKFAQNIFDADIPIKDKGFGNAFQIITGSTPSIPIVKPDQGVTYPFLLETYLSEKCESKSFVGICNFKLSNPLLIGNGHKFLDEVYQLIIRKKNELNNDKPNGTDGLEIIILQTYAWHEISVLVFTDHIDDIGTFIKSLRWQPVKNLKNSDEIISGSMFSNDENKNKDFNIGTAHVFADTHTYIGIKYQEVIDFKEDCKGKLVKDITFKSYIEFQTKPGHLDLLKDQLNKDEFTKDVFHTDKPYFITGKTDFIFKFKDDNLNAIQTNIKILKWIKGLNGEFKNFRKIKTRLGFKTRDRVEGDLNDAQQEIDEKVSYGESLKKLIICPIESKSTIENQDDYYNKIEQILRKNKVSRALTLKIKKLYFLYNSAIQDQVNFSHMMDFYSFMKFLDNSIKKLEKGAKNSKLVADISEPLHHFTEVFDQGYYMRMFNSYFADDLGDSVDLDMNTSIQQLLSTYTVITNSVAKLYFSENTWKNGYAQIVQINLTNTVSSHLFINYSIENLTSPELFFSTQLKEIINATRQSTAENGLLGLMKPHIEARLKLIISYNSTLKIMYENGNIDDEYLAADINKFIFSFNCDTDLYVYYFWLYLAQTPSLYTTAGNINISRFQEQLFRLMFVVALFDPDKLEQLKCPNDLFFSLWHTIFHKFLLVFQNLEVIEDLKYLSDALFSRSFKGIIKDDEVHEGSIADYFKQKNIILPDYRKRLTNFYEVNFQNLIKDNLNFEGYFNPKNTDISISEEILALMYGYMKFMFEKNNKTVAILLRDESGAVIKQVDDDDSFDGSYYADPLGGIFFKDRDKATNYFQSRDAMIQTLWHIAQVEKNEIIKNIKI